MAAVLALHEQGDGFVISASHGLVLIPDEVDTAGEALRRADERMVRAASAAAVPGRPSQARDVLAQLLAERGAGRTRSRAVRSRSVAGSGSSAEELDVLARAAELRDVGLVAVPDEVLASADPEADPLFRSHIDRGRAHPVRRRQHAPGRAACSAPRASASTAPASSDALRGEEIPLGARIIAACVADDPEPGAYDPARGRGAQRALPSLAELALHLRDRLAPCGLRAYVIAWFVSLRPWRVLANFISVFIRGDMSSQTAHRS